jgi:hypothetical protein
MLNGAIAESHMPGYLSGPRLRGLVRRLRALHKFARVVGYDRNSRMTEAEQDKAWDRWHLRFERALRAARRAR